jgi:exopolysaccharide biosynthesis polyprenyl glycosylphosphotransferase
LVIGGASAAPAFLENGQRRVTLQDSAKNWQAPPGALDFVADPASQRPRYSQRIICHLLSLAEATMLGALAIFLLSHRSLINADIRIAAVAGTAIASNLLLVMFLSGSATYERFTSRMSMLATGATAAVIMMAVAVLGGGTLVAGALAAAILFLAVFLAKGVTRLVKGWLEARGHLTRLVAVAADDDRQRAALIELLRQRSDIRLVFAGSPSQFDALSALTQDNRLDEIVLSGHQAIEENIAALAGLAVTIVRVTPQDRLDIKAFDPIWGRKQVFGPWSAPTSVVVLPPLRGWRGVAKRAIDLVGAIVGIVLLSPLLLICAIAVKLDSPGPVLFIQERAGYRNKPFRMYKFRSMAAEKADPTGSQLTLRNDPRVTKVGALLRRTSLDELPQIFNVLKGDMSLVGPRPHPKGAKAGATLYEELIPNFYSRYRMKPGITGLAQVSGLRGNTETEQHLIDRFGRDLQYAAEWTPILDFALLLRTVAHVLKGTNAY